MISSFKRFLYKLNPYYFFKLKRIYIRIRTYILINTNPYKNKIGNFEKCFIIGMPKTGTTSTKDFLKLYNSKHLTINPFTSRLYKKGKRTRLFELIDKFNSFDDYPWNKIDIIEETMKMDRNFVYIYTKRNPLERFESSQRYRKARGVTQYDPSKKNEIIKKQMEHEKRCKLIAKKFKKKILFIDVTTNPNSNKIIASFLGFKKIKDFPHSNKTSEHMKKVRSKI